VHKNKKSKTRRRLGSAQGQLVVVDLEFNGNGKVNIFRKNYLSS